MNKAMFAALPLIALVGCVDDRPAMPGPARECRAGPAQRFIGRAFTPRLSRQVQRAAGARNVRALRPGQPATMDYRGDRLNIMLDERNRIASVNCG
ncbi:I78 family peptidase inhibitor [uncultured Sphingomonas sp.]|uniref:I78 family peptidase inhibitor n=1 Tax=uncultured Sphingomonas sp. TaxID=158754 RepID=UPI00263A1714|nr:I78 family peptidase inhibitor [uncultured Sphingomonas sp.]